MLIFIVRVFHLLNGVRTFGTAWILTYETTNCDCKIQQSLCPTHEKKQLFEYDAKLSWFAKSFILFQKDLDTTLTENELPFTVVFRCKGKKELEWGLLSVAIF